MGEPINLRILREPEAQGLPLPRYHSDAASGMDVCAAVAEPVVMPPGAVRLIPTGFRMAVPKGYEIQVRPRSGLALKNGVMVVNSPGTIDADYRGLVGIILGNFGERDFVVNRGDRIAQLVVQRVETAVVAEVDSLDDTARGEGGFGSSGV